MTDKAHFWEGLVHPPVSRSSRGEGMTVCGKGTAYGRVEYALTCLLYRGKIVSRVWFINDAFKKKKKSQITTIFLFYLIFSTKLNIIQKMQIDDISGNYFNAVHSTCL